MMSYVDAKEQEALAAMLSYFTIKTSNCCYVLSSPAAAMVPQNLPAAAVLPHVAAAARSAAAWLPPAAAEACFAVASHLQGRTGQQQLSSLVHVLEGTQRQLRPLAFGEPMTGRLWHRAGKTNQCAVCLHNVCSALSLEVVTAQGGPRGRYMTTLLGKLQSLKTVHFVHN